MKVRRHEEVQAKRIVQVVAPYLLRHKQAEKRQDVNDEQILGDRWYF